MLVKIKNQIMCFLKLHNSFNQIHYYLKPDAKKRVCHTIRHETCRKCHKHINIFTTNSTRVYSFDELIKIIHGSKDEENVRRAAAYADKYIFFFENDEILALQRSIARKLSGFSKSK